MAAIRDLRDQIRFLESRGQLVRVQRPVETRFEIAAVAKRMETGPALLFESVRGYDIPVLIGTDNDRGRIAAALGTDNAGFIDHYLNAIQNPIPPVEVDDGPVHEVVQTEDVDLLRDLPILTHYERDGGPYITTGIVFAEDPVRGIRNLSYQRLQVTGRDELRALIQPRHLWTMYQEAEARGEALPIAIVLGLDGAVRLAGATWGSTIPLELDELGIAGALKGRPEPIVRCVTCDVRVPANAEIVLECEILPHVRKPEGPFAEFTGNYGDVWDNPVVRVRAVCRRRRPIYQALLTFSSEHHLLLGLPYEPTVLKLVRGYVRGARAVHITPAGCGKFHAVVQIEKRHEGDGKDAILAGLYAVRDIKLVTVVDTDVDPFNPRDVEWAISTRFQADRDLVVVAGAKGNELDPSCPEVGLTAKMGIDATKPLARAERFEKVRVPGADELRIEDYLS
jgi:2,5-furandicarboxylate decarboxylase 1